MEAVNGASDGGPPPPSPLTGCYLLIVIGEPHSQEHKDIILRRVAKGLLSWDMTDCMVDLEKELAIITEQAPEGEEARYGERLIQYASENLVTEILIHPAVSTLSQCVRNLLSSFTRHRHIIHSGYTFAANGSWALQDGTFSFADFSEAFQELEVQRVIRAYDNGISVDIHCSPEGDWTRLPKEPFAKNCKVRLNPVDVMPSSSPAIADFLNYITPFLLPLDIITALESSEVVGNIRFSHPTLYVFPGGQGDAALFGINGFNMLLDGGFSRKACFWDFVRHLDRLDAVLLTRLNNSNVSGITSVLKRKRQNAVYPQIGHFFCNIQERKALLSPDGDKDCDPLLINLMDKGQDIVTNLKHLHLSPQTCYRDSEPINLYHKVGHGTLDMYVLSPAKDSREVREFIHKWNSNDNRLFSNPRSKEFSFPIPNLVSICALLVWQPSNFSENITRILFPGSTPQTKIFEGLDRLKQLDCIKYPVCSEISLNPPKKTKEQIFDSSKSQKILPEVRKERSPRLNEIKPKEIKEAAKIQDNKINDTPDVRKDIKKSDSTDSDKSAAKSVTKVEQKVNKDAKETTTRMSRLRDKDSKSVERKPAVKIEKKPSPTTPKKTMTNGDAAKPKLKLSPSATPAKSAKEATNRKVLESKKQIPRDKKEPKPADKKPETEKKVERKPISRRPKPAAAPAVKAATGSPIRKKPESIAKKAKLDKEGTTDSSTVSTPTADIDLKRDISKLTPEELEQLKAQELADLQEEQEVVQEIEAVFRKGEVLDANKSEMRKIKNISIEEKTDEDYLVIEKVEIQEDEIQKLTRDSEESEKQRKLSEPKNEVAKEIISLEEKVDKVESGTQPDEKFSATVESGATTAPTLPEDERIPLDDIKEKEDTHVIEEKHVKEETKEKEFIPVIQLPSKSIDSTPPVKTLPVVGIRLDKQQHIRDIVKTPDEVADLPVHEVADHYADYQKNTDEQTTIIVKEALQDAKADVQKGVEEMKNEVKEVVDEICEEYKKIVDKVQDDKADEQETNDINAVKDSSKAVEETLKEVQKTAVDISVKEKVDTKELVEQQIEKVTIDEVELKEAYETKEKVEEITVDSNIEAIEEDESIITSEIKFSEKVEVVPTTTEPVKLGITEPIKVSVENIKLDEQRVAKLLSKDTDSDEQIILAEKEIDTYVDQIPDEQYKTERIADEAVDANLGAEKTITENISAVVHDGEPNVKSQKIVDIKDFEDVIIETIEKIGEEIAKEVVETIEEAITVVGLELEDTMEEVKKSEEEITTADADANESMTKIIESRKDGVVESTIKTTTDIEETVVETKTEITKVKEEISAIEESKETDDIEDVIIETIEKVGEEIAKDVVETIEEAFTVVGRELEDSIKELKISDEEITTTTEKKTEGVKETIITIADANEIITETIECKKDGLVESEEITQVKEEISAIEESKETDDIEDVIIETIEKISEEVTKKVVETIEEAMTVVGLELEDTIKQVKISDEEMTTTIEKKTEGVKETITTIADANESIDKTNGSRKNGIVESTTEIKETVAETKPEISQVKEIDNIEDVIVETIEKIGEEIAKEVVETIEEAMTVVGRELEDTTEEVKELAEEVGTTIEEKTKEVKETITTVADPKESITETIESKKDGVVESNTKTTTEIEEIIAGTKAEVTNVKEEISAIEESKETDDIEDVIIETIEKVGEEIAKEVVETIEEAMTVVELELEDTMEEVKELAEEVGTTIEEKTEEVKETITRITDSKESITETIESKKDGVVESNTKTTTEIEEIIAGTKAEVTNVKEEISTTKEGTNEILDKVDTSVKEQTDVAHDFIAKAEEKIDDAIENITDIVIEKIHQDNDDAVVKEKILIEESKVEDNNKYANMEANIIVQDVDTGLPVFVNLNESPESPCPTPFDYIDKVDLGRKSPKEREQDVAKIVASVAEVLKSEAPLEDFKGKIPLEINTFPTFPPFTTELRETHITTLDSPITEMSGQITPIKEEKIDEVLKEMEGDIDSNSNTSKISALIKTSNELLEASSKMISDIKERKDEEILEKVEEEEEVQDNASVHRMLVTASSEDGGEETVICSPGSIKFPKSSESSGKSSPDIHRDDGVKPEATSHKSSHEQEAFSVLQREPEISVKMKSEDIPETKNKVDIDEKKPEVVNHYEDNKKVEERLEMEIKAQFSGRSSPHELKSGKATPELLSSGKSTPDVTKTGKVDESVHKSGKSTPDILKSDKASPDVPESEKSDKNTSNISKEDIKIPDIPVIEKKTPDVLAEIVTAESVISDISMSDKIDSDVSKSGKSIPDIPKSGKATPDVQKSDKIASDIEGVVLMSGKDGLDIKLSDKSKIPQTGKITPDISKSEMTSPDIEILEEKETVTHVVKESVETVNVSSVEIKETLNMQTDLLNTGKTTSGVSKLGMTTPDVSESILTEVEASKSGKTTPDISKLGKVTPDSCETELVVTETLKSGKTTPDVLKSGKATPDISSSGDILDSAVKSAQDLNQIGQHTSESNSDDLPSLKNKTAPEIPISGTSTPDIAKSGKASPDDFKSDKLAADLETSTLEPLKSGKDTPDDSHSAITTSDKSTLDILQCDKVITEVSVEESVEGAMEKLSSGKLTSDIPQMKSKQLCEITDTEKRTPVVIIEKENAKVDKIDLEVKSYETVKILSGKSTPEVQKSGKSTPDLPKSGKMSPELEHTVNGKISPDNEKFSDQSKFTKEFHESTMTTTSASVGEEKKTGSITVTSQITTQTHTESKEVSKSPVIEETTSGRLTCCQRIENEKEAELSTYIINNVDSGKDTPEINNISGKSSPDIHKPIDKSQEIEKLPVLSGKATPDIEKSGKSSPDFAKGDSIKVDNNKVVFGEATLDVNVDLPSSVASQSIQMDTDSLASGKLTPDVKYDLSSGKITPDVENHSTAMETDSLASGKQTPDLKKQIVSGKSTPDVGFHDGPEKTLSGKSTPESNKASIQASSVHIEKEEASSVIVSKSEVFLSKSTQDNKEDSLHIQDNLKSGKSTPLSNLTASGKNTPDLSSKRDSVYVDDINNLAIDSQMSGKSTPDIKSTDTIDSRKDSIQIDCCLSGKSTPDVLREEIIKISGKESPVIDDSFTIRKNSTQLTVDIVSSGKSTPEVTSELTKQKSGIDLSEVVKSDSISAAKDTSDLTHKEERKRESITNIPSGKTTPDIGKCETMEMDSHLDKFVSSDALQQSGKSSPEQEAFQGNLTSGKSTPISSEHQNGVSSIASGKSTPGLSGKVTPEPDISSGKSSPQPATKTHVESRSIVIESKEMMDDSNDSGFTTSSIVTTTTTVVQSSVVTTAESLKEEIKTHVFSGAASPDFTKRSSIQAEQILSGKSTPEKAKFTPHHDGSGKSTPDFGKRSSIQAEHILSGKSTPDISKSDLGRTESSSVSTLLQGKTSPDVHLLENQGNSADTINEVSSFDVTQLQSAHVYRELMKETITSSIDAKKETDVLLEKQDTFKIETIKETLSGKSSPELIKDSRKSSVLSGADESDYRKFSITSETTKTPSMISGKSTPEWKDERPSIQAFIDAERQSESISSPSKSDKKPSHGDLMSASTFHADPMSTSFYGALPDDSDDEDLDRHRNETDLMTSSFIGNLPTEDKVEQEVKSWGPPLGLPSPMPPSDNKGTPKKEKRLPMNVSAKNKLNQRSESPSKKKKMNPIYVDLTYVPHHGNSYYSQVDFFKRVRARYYVFSGIEPSKDVYNALLEAKQTWEDKQLEVTIIPTYDTDILGYWVAENEELLTKFKIDLSPSASRCTINLQDHETSCSAYRLEF